LSLVRFFMSYMVDVPYLGSLLESLRPRDARAIAPVEANSTDGPRAGQSPRRSVVQQP
jgi:hypothetical protein